MKKRGLIFFCKCKYSLTDFDTSHYVETSQQAGHTKAPLAF
jgi:hypothetical protein